MRRTISIDPLRFSLVILTSVVLIGLTGLVITANWPKVVRVTLAATGYLGVLAVRTRATHSLQWWPFACAGGLAGVISGALQPSISYTVLLASAAGGAFLLGTVHWLALRYSGSLPTEQGGQARPRGGR
jgi:hypothetical protein